MEPRSPGPRGRNESSQHDKESGDRNIGRLLNKLDEIGAADNPVISFLSDNGACEDSADRSTVKGSMPWEVTSYLTQGRVWANASNTPFRKYKTTDYEGGVHTPMIAYWPGTTAAGTWTSHVGHLIDFTPTMLDLAGAEIPDELPGHSLVPTLQGKETDRPWPLYFQFGNYAAIRDRDWKAVRVRSQKTWELYNLAEDPAEISNVASEHTDRTQSMAAAWEQWWKDRGSVK